MSKILAFSEPQTLIAIPVGTRQSEALNEPPSTKCQCHVCSRERVGPPPPLGPPQPHRNRGLDRGTLTQDERHVQGAARAAPSRASRVGARKTGANSLRGSSHWPSSPDKSMCPVTDADVSCTFMQRDCCMRPCHVCGVGPRPAEKSQCRRGARLPPQFQLPLPPPGRLGPSTLRVLRS